MLDTRPTAYIVPIAEQVLDDITPVVQVTSSGDEPARVTGLIRIYRKSTDQLLYTSELATTIVPGHATVNIAALSAWSPPAPADDDFFILCDTLAKSVAEPSDEDQMRAALGAWCFDVKPGPMGPAPAAHHVTHESGGMDEVVVTGLQGVLAEGQTPALHAVSHQDGQSDELNVAGLHGELADPQPPLAHAATHATGGSDELEVETLPTSELDDTFVLAPDGAGGVEFRAEAGGGVTDHGDLTGLADDDHPQYSRQTTPQVLTDQAGIDWDLNDGGAATVTLGGDRTLNEAANMASGSRYSLRAKQDATGTRLLTWHATYRFPGGVVPCLSAAPGNIDIFQFDCDGTHLDCVGMVNALA